MSQHYPQHQLSLKQPVWVHKNNRFIKAMTTSISKQQIICIDQHNQLFHSKQCHVYPRNPSISTQFDPSRSDLMDIDLINQPQILQNIKKRFIIGKQIYSFVENTLLILNPYEYIEGLYDDELKEYYAKKIIQERKEIRECLPHVYAITAKMIKEVKETKKPQAIIISGESGAGKTEANKQCLRWLNYYYQHQNKNNNSNLNQHENKVQKAIQISSPILQAFGNSKTIRNNNSSRFGKFLSISICPQTNQIKHAQFYNYLLQTSRIISRSKNQQNFHIFYEFVNKLNGEQREKYGMVDENGKAYGFGWFNYLKVDNGNVKSNNFLHQQQVPYIAHPDISFQSVKSSISLLPASKCYDFVCRILSSVLLLGNIQPYLDQQNDTCQILPKLIFHKISSLLYVDPQQLQKSLTSYHIKVGHEYMTKYFGVKQVQELINSLAKCLYEKLFGWLVGQLNQLSGEWDQKDKKGRNQEENKKINNKKEKIQQQQIKLGFLDIYGFEVLENNGLQQLFINYTNQRLHQIYLHKIFKQQKLLFQHQSLLNKYTQCQFTDNLSVIDLIDYNSLSIFNLLDQWCSVASPDQSSFITKLRFNHKKHGNFPVSNFNLPSTLFRITHTPKDIDYNVNGFREKNKDLLRNEIKNVLKGANDEILQELFTEDNQINMKSTSISYNNKQSHQLQQQQKPAKKFLSSKFRLQMQQLLSDLSTSQLHFIRCLKSNNLKKSLFFQQQAVFNQICYLGILDTIKIKKQGYCIKLSYQTIDDRFKWLVRYYFIQNAFKKQIIDTLSRFLIRFKNDEILYGKNKIFFKDFAYNVLVKKYNAYVDELKTKVDKIITLMVKNLYLNKKERKFKAIHKIQYYILSIAYSKKHQTKIKNIKQIQKKIRMYLQHCKVKKKIQNIRTVQIYIKRSIQARNRLIILNSVQKITNLFRKAVFRKKLHSRVIVTKILHQFINDSIMIVALNQIHKIQSYIQTVKIQEQKSTQLAIANLNVYHIYQQKHLNCIQKYFQSFLQTLGYTYYMEKVYKVQNLMKGWLIRKNYLRLKKAVIKIQCAWRDYYFRKMGSKEMFGQTYKYYFQKIQNQNKGIQSYLYRLQQDQQQSTIQDEYIEYLSKFKQKFSILYFMIDFQSYVDLDICYPFNSWPLNYFRVQKQGFNKDNPIQTIQVGDSFTVAVSTSKVYVWGMNEEYGTLDNYMIVKGKGQVETVKVNVKRIDVKYEVEDGKEKDKSNYNTQVYCNTIKRKFMLESGKVSEFIYSSAKIIRFPQNQRIAYIACGNQHVIFQSISKKIYTMGNGKKGQLGHGVFTNQQHPRLLRLPQSLKNYHPVQIQASSFSSIILFNHKKIVWFGTNGTIKNCANLQYADLKIKCKNLSNSQHFLPIKLHVSWSATTSIIGVSILCFNDTHNQSQIHIHSKLQKPITLRNKTVDVLIQKWCQQWDRINPPYSQGVVDWLEQCHVKLPKVKIKIQPEGKKRLREMEEKVKEYKQGKKQKQIIKNGENGKINQINKNKNDDSMDDFSFSHVSVSRGRDSNNKL